MATEGERQVLRFERMSREASAGSALTAERLGLVSGPALDRATIHGPRVRRPTALTRGNKPRFMLGLDSLAELVDGTVTLG